ncbi:hypothetical protein DFH29DRAFT_998464 [Suillus ampliporus]|nr:hypothetical protein DFH29DRAFT_998464 [Suillus ampliporus]
MAKTSNNMSPIEAGQVFCTLNAAIVVLCPNVAGFYVVVIGYQCGIYLSWRDCEVNVTGYRSPLFKKVTTFAEAMEWFVTKGALILSSVANHTNQEDLTRAFEHIPRQFCTSTDDRFPIVKFFSVFSVESLQPPVHLDTIGDIEQHQNTRNQHQLPGGYQIIHNQLPGSYQIIRNQLPGGYQIIRKHNLAISLPSIATSARFLAFNSTPLPSFGFLADNYLQAHGYTMRALLHVQHAVHTSDSHEQFSRALSLQGMPVTEATFLWNLISMDADYNDGPLET